jgi:rhamnogalacturonyl hydrolase YesR
MTHKGWDHSNSIILHGMEKIYEHNRNPACLNYIRSFADAFINADGTIKGLTPAPRILCRINDIVSNGILSLYSTICSLMHLPCVLIEIPTFTNYANFKV